MHSVRIHSNAARADGSIPYVSARMIDDARLQLNLDDLDPGLNGVSFCLTLANVYHLLEGKSLCLQLPLVDCLLTPDNRELRLDVQIEGAQGHLAYPLALSELALAWNMMRTGPSLF